MIIKLDVYQNISPASDDFWHLIPISGQSMAFYYSSEDEFVKAITGMKASSSLEDIPSLILKLSKHQLAKYLSELFNLCIDQGEFPDVFKISPLWIFMDSGVVTIAAWFKSSCFSLA